MDTWNILDYIKWRGDLSFEEREMNDLDAMILSIISIVDFSGIAEDKILFRKAKDEFFKKNPNIDKLGLLIPKQVITLLYEMGESNRFGSLYISDFFNKISVEKEMQISALIFHLPNNKLFVSYSGTDDTVIGWKENLNMMHMDFVPSQLEAIKYMDTITDKYEKTLIVGGHSKGGNMALVSSAYCKDYVETVYFFDAPGMSDFVYNSNEYKGLESRIKSFVPDTSVVGRLFNQPSNYNVVRSSLKGVYQHNPFSWLVKNSSFIYAEKLSKDSQYVEKRIKDIILSLSQEDRIIFSDAFFKVLSTSNTNKLSELNGKTINVIGQFMKLNKQEKRVFHAASMKLIRDLTVQKVFVVGYKEFRRRDKKEPI